MKFLKQSHVAVGLLLCICLFFSTTSAQHKIIEDFINQAAREIVPANFNYYNLVDSSFIIKFNQYSFEPDDHKQILAQYPDFPLDSFLTQVGKSTLINWKDFDLSKAKLYSRQTVPKLETGIRVFKTVSYDTPKKIIDSLNNLKPHTALTVPVKKHWNNERIDQACDKAYEQYIKRVPREERVYFRFSTPLIIDDYAMVSLNTTGSGATYIFKRINNFWQKIFMLEHWVV